jgi:hypothetical protein
MQYTGLLATKPTPAEEHIEFTAYCLLGLQIVHLALLLEPWVCSQKHPTHLCHGLAALSALLQLDSMERPPGNGSIQAIMLAAVLRAILHCVDQASRPSRLTCATSALLKLIEQMILITVWHVSSVKRARISH